MDLSVNTTYLACIVVVLLFVIYKLSVNPKNVVLLLPPSSLCSTSPWTPSGTSQDSFSPMSLFFFLGDIVGRQKILCDAVS